MEVMTRVLNAVTVVNLVAAWLYLTVSFAPILTSGVVVGMAFTVTALAMVSISKGVFRRGWCFGVGNL